MIAGTVICSDCPEELAHALTKTSQQARETGRLLWIYSQDGFFVMTDTYPDVPRNRLVAECYPGGRNILWRQA